MGTLLKGFPFSCINNLLIYVSKFATSVVDAIFPVVRTVFEFIVEPEASDLAWMSYVVEPTVIWFILAISVIPYEFI